MRGKSAQIPEEFGLIGRRARLSREYEAHSPIWVNMGNPKESF